MILVVGVAVHVRHRSKKIVSQQFQVGQKIILNMGYRVLELRAIGKSGGGNLFFCQFCSVSTSNSDESHLVGLAEDDIGGRTDKDISVGTHIFRIGGCGDAPLCGDGSCPRTCILTCCRNGHSYSLVIINFCIGFHHESYTSSQNCCLKTCFLRNHRTCVRRPHLTIGRELAADGSLGPAGT